MKVLVATHESQGMREWDLWRGCVEGELVVLVAPYAGELARVAAGLRGIGVVERWDEWMGLRFEADGELRSDITELADIDPAELEDID